VLGDRLGGGVLGGLHQEGLGVALHARGAVLVFTGGAQVQGVPVEADAGGRVVGEVDDPPALGDGEGVAAVPDADGLLVMDAGGAGHGADEGGGGGEGGERAGGAAARAAARRPLGR